MQRCNGLAQLGHGSLKFSEDSSQSSEKLAHLTFCQQVRINHVLRTGKAGKLKVEYCSDGEPEKEMVSNNFASVISAP